MATARKVDSEEYTRSQTVAREIRENVADQLHDLVIERDDFGSYDELAEKVRAVAGVGQRIREAKGRQKQAAELGLPLQPGVDAEREALEALRAAVMNLGAACGAWVTHLDFEKVRPDLEAQARIGRRRQSEDEENI